MIYKLTKYGMIFRKIMKRNSESEKDLEARLVKEVETRGGMAIKLTSQFHRGLPDRLVLCPYHTLAFVELKSTGQKPTALQDATHRRLRAMHFTVRLIDSNNELDMFLEELDERLEQQGERTMEFRAKKAAAIKAAKRQLVKEQQEQSDDERLKASVDRLMAKWTPEEERRRKK